MSLAANDNMATPDLFGEPMVTPRGRGGRPALRWPPELRARIEAIIAAGATAPTIALAVGVSRPTIRKYFFGPSKARPPAAPSPWHDQAHRG